MFLTKKFKKKIGVMFLNFLKNAMIKNMKIHNIFYILYISKSMEPNKCIIIIYFMKMFS